jgi:cytoskeleton protein RodZ
MGAFGDKFRKARESKELSFDDVSNVIKISPRMLRAIEEENFDQLPGGVFNKGFIRSYAKHIGLDPEEAITEYLDYVRQQQIQAQQAWQPEPPVETRAPAKAAAAKKSGASSTSSTKTEAPVQAREELPNLQLPRAEHVRAGKKQFLARSSPDIPWKIVAVAVVVLILASLLFWIRHSHRERLETANVASPQSQPAPQTAAPAPAASTPPAGAAGSPAPNSAAAQPGPAASSAANPDDEKSDVTVRNFGQPLPKSPATSTDKSSGSLMLTVRATENSWISISADGQPLTEETLIAPAHPTFRASQKFVVKVGNAAAVSFLWNGQEIPPQGGEGEVKSLVFDSTGMHAASPSQPTPNQ